MDSSLEGGDKKNFFKHVFNFDDRGKADMLNIIQYSVIGIIPIVVLNKLMQKYVPEADDQKGSIELLAEVVIQVVFMFLGILITHRIVTFVPTYSEEKYPEFSVIYIILAVLLITLSLQTKLGEKVSILSDRVFELWEGKPAEKAGNKKKARASTTDGVKVSQPISQNSYYTENFQNKSGTTALSDLPVPPTKQTMAPQQLPDYNNMYANTSNPLVNADTPGINEPMAANDALGGSFSGFGAW
jgi:hypothetical protein